MKLLDFESGGYIQIDVPKIEVDFKDMVIQEEYIPEWDKFGLWDLKNEKRRGAISCLFNG